MLPLSSSVSAPKMAADSTPQIHCDAHGSTDPCMVCAHLRAGTHRGFNPAQDPNPDASWSQLREAWCDRCDWWWSLPRPLSALYNKLAARPRMVCAVCFDAICKSNEHPGRVLGWWER